MSMQNAIHKMNSSKGPIIIGITILLYFLLGIKGNFTDTVIFAGDEWEYQVIGTNQYYGHGFMVTGKLEDIDEYKLTELDNDKIRFWEAKSGKAYYRSPLYPFFLFVFYKIFGVHPLVVKLFQLILVFVAGLLLIKIMEKVLEQKGLVLGIIAYIIFVLSTYKFAEHLMPENWQLVFISLITYLLFFHFQNKPVHSVFLGAVLALSVLNKGTSFFILPIVFIYDIYLLAFCKKKRISNMLFLFISFSILTGSWSYYLSKQINKPVFVTTQASDVLLDGNNEYCNDGLWHPEWRNNNESWYYTSNVNTKSNLRMVVAFYAENPKYLMNLINKVKIGFFTSISFKILLGIYFSLLIVYIIISNNFKYFHDKKIRSPANIPFPFIILFLNFFLFTLLFYSCNEVYVSRYVKTMEGITIATILLIIERFSEFIMHLKKESISIKNHKKN